MRTTGPKCRICRRIGEKLFLKGEKCTGEKCPVALGAPAPGQQNMKHPKGKPSEFKKQMVEKQKIRKSYDVTERILHNYYDKASSKTGKTGDLIMQMLETRLDNVVYRAGFAVGRPQSRQFTSHGHFHLNGRRVDIPSIQVRAGDIITIRPESKNDKFFSDLKPTSSVRWLKVDPKKLEITVTALPEADDSSDHFSIQSVVEFYSR